MSGRLVFGGGLVASAIAERTLGAAFATTEKVDFVFFCSDFNRLETGALVAAITERLLLTQAATAPPIVLPPPDSGGQGQRAGHPR